MAEDVKLTENDEGFFRRRFPRRQMVKPVGMLSTGDYLVTESQEIGEGGMSLSLRKALPEGTLAVLTFQIPMGDFVSIRVIARSSKKGKYGSLVQGFTFENIPFSNKRQIRAYVSARQNV